jgi:hypothetical protein
LKDAFITLGKSNSSRKFTALKIKPHVNLNIVGCNVEKSMTGFTSDDSKKLKADLPEG